MYGISSYQYDHVWHTILSNYDVDATLDLDKNSIVRIPHLSHILMLFMIIVNPLLLNLHSSDVPPRPRWWWGVGQLGALSPTWLWSSDFSAAADICGNKDNDHTFSSSEYKQPFVRCFTVSRLEIKYSSENSSCRIKWAAYSHTRGHTPTPPYNIPVPVLQV